MYSQVFFDLSIVFENASSNIIVHKMAKWGEEKLVDLKVIKSYDLSILTSGYISSLKGFDVLQGPFSGWA